MPTILVATDFSTGSDRAVRRATLIARQFGYNILLIKVVDDEQPRRLDAELREITALLAELERTIAEVDGVECTTALRFGKSFEQIVSAAEEAQAELIVVGPHRRRLLLDQFQGTTVDRVIRRSRLPVLVANAVPVGAYGRVLLSTDLESHSATAALVRSLPFCQQADLVLLHVYDPVAQAMLARGLASPEQRQALARDDSGRAQEALNEFAAAAGIAHVRLLVRPSGGSIPKSVLDTAADEEADLVVVASHDKGPLEKAIIGSTTEGLLRESSRDVLVITGSD